MAGRIAAGDLTERVTLHYQAEPLPDGQGGFRKGAESIRTVSAQVRVLSSRETLALGQTLAGRVAEVTIRAPRQVDVNTTQLSWDYSRWNIQRVDKDPRREFLTLTCITNGRG
jgi:head-tail adaptor